MTASTEGATGAKWHVVQSKRFAEGVAKERLEAQGFEVYLPYEITEGRDPRTGKPKSFVRPFFARTMFVLFDPEAPEWRRIFSTRGVASMFMAGGKPVRVREEDIQYIKDREEHGYIKLGDASAKAAKFSRGDKVKISGATCDIEGVFDGVDSDRASILITLLGRQCRAQVSLLNLR